MIALLFCAGGCAAGAVGIFDGGADVELFLARPKAASIPGGGLPSGVVDLICAEAVSILVRNDSIMD